MREKLISVLRDATASYEVSGMVIFEFFKRYVELLADELDLGLRRVELPETKLETAKGDLLVNFEKGEVQFAGSTLPFVLTMDLEKDKESLSKMIFD